METELIGKLAEALSKAQGEYPAIAKGKIARIRTKQGAEYSYAYADLCDIFKAILPVLARHGLALCQPLRRVDGKLFLTSELHHAGGEHIASAGILLPENVTPQELGSALTYARRYDACSLLGVAAEEDDDGAAASAPSRRARQMPDAQVSPQSNNAARAQETAPVAISEGQRRRLFALAKERGVNHDTLKDFIFRRFNYVTSKDVLRKDYEEICAWIQSGGEGQG